MASMNRASALGEFLRASRSRVTPAEAGLVLYGTRRRVVGLRREELAMLAGVSSSYYTRVEQGWSGASVQVLDSIATVLQLSESERVHLHTLATNPDVGLRPRSVHNVPVSPALLELLDSVSDTPALVIGSHTEVLAWNPLGHALIASHLPENLQRDDTSRPVLALMVFLDPDFRSLYVNWRAKARAVVGDLRLSVARYPGDEDLASVIGALSMRSGEFVEIWAENRVKRGGPETYELQHPHVGRLTVTKQSFRSTDNSDQTLIVHTAVSGSPSAEALALLHHVAQVRTGSP